jgi:hypothetical protein
MTMRKPKIQKTHGQLPEKKKPQKKSHFVAIEVNPNFPFKELMCAKEHKELFEDLFGRK